MAMLSVWQTEALRVQSQIAGAHYRQVSNALQEYMAIFHSQLLGLPDECSTVTLAVPYSLSSPDSVQLGACLLKLSAVNGGNATVKVENGLQPSIEDFKNLHLLDSTFKNTLLMPTVGMVAQPINHLSSPDLVPPGYATRIEKVCSTPSCGSYQLTGLTYNTQPYARRYARSLVSSLELLQTAQLAAGPDAAISTIAEFQGDNELYGYGKSFSVRNPLRIMSATGSTGLADILALRSGYASSSMAQYAQTDGSRKITGTWNFNGHDIQGIQRIDAQQLTLDELQVKQLKLPSENPGSRCNSQTQSIAVSTQESQLLVCKKEQWTFAVQ